MVCLNIQAVAVQKKATVLKMSGEVVSLDTAAKMLTVKNKKGDMTFNVGEKTKIMMGKHKKLLANLKAGDKVSVSYSQLEGKNMAEKIVMAAKKK